MIPLKALVNQEYVRIMLLRKDPELAALIAELENELEDSDAAADDR